MLALGLGAAALAAPAASAHQQTRTEAVSTWNENAGKAAVAACISPVGPSPAEARLYAMTHVAIHDALNAIDRRSQPYAYHGRALRHASLDAAVATAARDLLVPVLGEFSTLKPECVGAAVASVEADYAAALDAVPDGRAKARGIAVGQDAATAILTLRAGDGAQQLLTADEHYPQGTEPGEYRFGPGATFVFAPHLGALRPFVLRDSAQFSPGPPHAVTNPHYTADYRQVKRLGGDDVTTPSARTTQTEIAMFWYESSPLQWNRIAQDDRRRPPARCVGAGTSVRPAQHGLDRRLHRHLQDQVRALLLAAGHRDPARRFGRESPHGRRPDLDAAQDDARDPRL